MVKIDWLTTIFSSIWIIHNSSSTAILLTDDWFKVHKRVLRNFKILKIYKASITENISVNISFTQSVSIDKSANVV